MTTKSNERFYLFDDMYVKHVDGYLTAKEIKDLEREHGQLVFAKKGALIVRAE